MSKGPRLNSRSLLESFLSKNAAIKNPIKIFIGAGAMAMEKGNKITHQYNILSVIAAPHHTVLGETISSLECIVLSCSFKSGTYHPNNNLKSIVIPYLLALRVTARMVSDRDFLNS